MTTSHSALRFAITGVVGAVLVAGCSGAKHSARVSGSASQAEQALAQGQLERAVSLAEGAVTNNPRDVAARATLGRAYLKGGRFESAVAALNDAMSLGDNSPRTALSLALAKASIGRGTEAVALLDDWKDSIPAADRGLALALAGETARGVAVLSDALRGGENTPKMRQNLAYAYALDGRWSEARVMASQDVSPDKLDARITEWAMAGKPENYRGRVAAMLKSPMRADPGMPQALALNNTPSAEQLAAEASAMQATPKGELPAVGGTTAVAVAEPAAALPAYQEPVQAAPAPVSQTASWHDLQTPVAQPAAAPMPAWKAKMRAARAAVATAKTNSTPVKTITAQASYRSPAKPMVATKQVAQTAKVVKVASAAAPAKPAANGNQMVQLGAFSSREGARRAWGLFAAQSPELKNYRMAISAARVNGKDVWRVAAAGLDASAAQSTCSSIKGRGGVCFAYAGNASKATSPKAASGEVKMASAKPTKAKTATATLAVAKTKASDSKLAATKQDKPAKLAANKPAKAAKLAVNKPKKAANTKQPALAVSEHRR